MKIGIDAHRLVQEELRRSGGVYLSNLVLNMARLTPDNEFLLYLNKSASAFDPKLSNCFLRPIPGPRVVWRQIRLPIAAYKDHVDVLFIPFHSVPRLWLGRLVVVIHDLVFLIVPEYFSKQTCRYLSLVTSYAVKHADRVIAVSESTKRDILKFYGQHLEQKIPVIYEAPKPSFSPLSDSNAAEYLLSHWALENGGYFLTVGTHPIKNLKGTLEAFQIARTQYKVEAKLVVVGNTNALVSQLVAEEGMGYNITLAGTVSGEELQILYSNAIALLFPSFYEGFGLPLVEAMACGCPVITSNVSSMPEIAGNAGILVDP
ncbi:MAG: glycosyltransferase family 4 protein, partial [Deltaproteobacteria bacterium]|nr:glycosyltransferase family 4 protein [Deltaproteobacteria bacterium]